MVQNPTTVGLRAANGGWTGQVWCGPTATERCPRPVLTRGKQVHDTS